MIDKVRELAYLEKNAFVEYIRAPMIDKNLTQEEQKNEVQSCIQNVNALLLILHLQFIKLPTENLMKTGNG